MQALLAKQKSTFIVQQMALERTFLICMIVDMQEDDT